MKKQLRPALMMFVLLTLITGVAYPLVITGWAKTIPHAAPEELVGRSFDEPGYFWGRLSATAPNAYNAQASTGSNLGPLNPALTAAAKARIDALRSADPDNDAPVPVDLVTSSGSGLDPHISPAGATYQVRRVARVRRLLESEVRALVAKHTEDRTFGVLGEPRINVRALNQALDALR